jgi:UDP-N-acetylglucosamine 2-epimerase (non-hydrolysing)
MQVAKVTSVRRTRSHVVRTTPACDAAVFMGARPNAPKAWTVCRGLADVLDHRGRPLEFKVVHSGQHYDALLGEGFARDLRVQIDVSLGVGPQPSDGKQLAALMESCDGALERLQPSCVIVMGDVNTTVAAALVAARRGIPVIHVEAGLRSRRWDPEEINRRAITACSLYHFAPSTVAVQNLLAEGVSAESVHLVGNTMAETFLLHSDNRKESAYPAALGLERQEYVLFTVHKTANIGRISWVYEVIRGLAAAGPTIFSCHPHTERVLADAGLEVAGVDNLVLTNPLAYHDFGRLLEDARCVVTDSAGLQEESTVAGVPCVTLGEESARPETVSTGTNIIAGYNTNAILDLASSHKPPSRRPEYWDHHVSKRIRKAMSEVLVDVARRDVWSARP